MSDYYFGALADNRGVTLNSLRDQLYSLNMRLLLAMQQHNEKSESEIRHQMAEVQEKIDRMSSGGGYQHHT